MAHETLSLALVVAVGIGAAGCERDKPKPAVPSASAPAPASAPAASAAPPPKPSAASDERDEPDAGTSDAGPGFVTEVSDVGPAAPSAAGSDGVYLLTKQDEIAVARLVKKGVLEPVKTPADQFALARSPAIAGGHAYFISNGRLARRPLGAGGVEVLAADARSGTRVTALPALAGRRPAAACFVGAPVTADGGPTARLWIEGHGVLVVTPEGSAATSVSMVELEGSLVVLSLEGRTGMTPVHARSVRFQDSKPELEQDVVVWVAGPAQSLTEITGATVDGQVFAFVPLARDITRFGLAQLQLGTAPAMGAPVVWRAYPNGLDPAPVAVSHGKCGTRVVYARPEQARPRAPQELHIASLGPSGLGPSQIVARASAFANVSAAETAAGVLVTYVADFRTWARIVACD